METILWKIIWKKGAQLDKFVVIKNVVGEAQYVWKDYGTRARVVLSEAQIQLAARNTHQRNNHLVT